MEKTTLSRLKNISQGGCALIVKDVNARFLYKDAVIKKCISGFRYILAVYNWT
ncbi:hypothetical protein [Citrobacter freundii]|uniref:Uncharacterized protein n=1 Tax=Citrobacter freundii TaxID=546 RepID=A0A7G2IL33_CITFR|nr:hypothetical protein [Citrobacter freundii]